MYCSKTAHAASASFVWAETTQPVAVIVGSRRTPAHVGAGRKTVLPLVLSLSAIALNQYPYWRIAIWPSLKSAPIQFGLGSIGVWCTPSAARSYRYRMTFRASGFPEITSFEKSAVYSVWF